MKTRFPSFGLLLASVLPSIAEASLAGRFSQNHRDRGNEISRIDRELASLPDIPQDDSGGMTAYAKYYGIVKEVSGLDVDSTITFTWREPAEVELVALIPARKFTPDGLESEYGFPDDYSLSLIDESGGVIATIADARSTSSGPVNRGLPYLHETKGKVKSAGLELRIRRLRPLQPDGLDIHFFALAEFLCFSGERNLMRNAEISFSYDKTLNSSPYWSPDFMVDGLTPLGLPELPTADGNPWRAIGWISQGKETEKAAAWITIDLGSPHRIDGVRIFPSTRPSLVTVPGFGIPRRYCIEASTTGDPESFRTVLPPAVLDMPNPGNNPVTNRFPATEARFVRLRTEKLWKPFQHYPAFLALSEIQILDGEENLAKGASVRASENPKPFAAQGEHFWSTESLTDDHGPKGLLVSRRTWLELLGKRKALEISRFQLSAELDEIESQWNLGASIGLGAVGIAGLLAVIVLPIRFRLRERRKIRTIRNRIAGDLHDEVGSNLGSIQLLAGAAQTKSQNADELRLINQVAAETVTSVRDIVWLLRPRSEGRDSTISHLRESASFLLDSVDWTLSTDLEDFSLSDEDGRNLVLFFREASSNLIRHSGARKAEIRIFRAGPDLCVEIEDDGCGIPTERLAQERTLRALKQRSKNLGGRLEIDSKIGRGTRLKLSFVPQPINDDRSLRYPFSGLRE